MIDVKICGLTQPDDMRLCAVLGVRWAGFVFHPASPRYLTLEQAQCLDNAAPSAREGGPLRVGLFVNPDLSQVRKVIASVKLDIFQFYGKLERILMLCQLINYPVWLAKGVRDKDDLPIEAGPFAGYVIEAPPETHDTRPGGLGRRIDWSLTQKWHAPAPWLLAGGLTPDNVQQAIAHSGARAVDVSSGVERAPGIKCPHLIEKFVKNARQGTCASP